jgi:lambda family phage minor tail protein L
MSLSAVVQSPNPGDLVTLFRLDALTVGGGIYYFAQATDDGAGVSFGGTYYTPIDVEFSDFETNANGSLPTPKMKIANSNEIIQGLVNSLGDMLGCGVARIRTFSRFLDGQPESDPSAFFGPDIFRIERKVNENPVFIEWELQAAIDQEGKMLPGRQIIRDTCTKRYRSYLRDEFRFDYTKATCPYAGDAYFDSLGQPTTMDKDRCGRRLSDCFNRYGLDAAIPFGGFPGAARTG